jgi:hypothetical protein
VNSAKDVADSNVGINGDGSNGINSNDKDDNSFDSKGGDFGDPNNGNSDDSEVGVKSQHSNASDMAIYAKEDSDMDNWSLPDSNTTGAYSVDLLNSD